MDTDYRELCRNLFGTDDVQELKRIARTIHEKNPRNAGRKKKFSLQEEKEIRQLVEGGMTIGEVAERYGTHRQMIGKYLHAAPERKKDCTLRIIYMYKTLPCTYIDVNFLERQVLICNKTDDVLRRAFGAVEKPTWEDFENFLRDRCFPATRGNKKELLEELGITDYDPLQILEKTKGRCAEDNMWMKFVYYPSA